MDIILYLFMLFLSPDGNFDENRDYASELNSYEVTTDSSGPVGKISFRDKQGVTTP
ncbi:hypothetical protein [Flavobacterium sp.]|uniref:hypothetical protein n=1 Tax=Flavobacterium sp. TaxID=239 RepID=UPI0035298C19